MPVSNQQLDEFGIPIKKTAAPANVDEFGIPIKKKDGGPALPSSPSLELPSVSTEPPKRLTYTDINSIIEKLSKAQKDLRELESAPGFTPGGYSPNYAKVNNDAIAAANKNVAKAKADRDKIFSEYAGEISRPVEQLIESQDYTKFFTPSGNIDYAKAREHFQKVSQQFGGGPALVEHWVANLKMRGQGEIERKEVKPLFEQKLKELGLQKYADQEQYAKSVFDGVVQKNKNQLDLLIQDRDQRANSLLDKYKDRIDYYTRDMNAVSSALNDFVQSGEMSEQEAKEKYDAQKSFYDERILEVNKEYETEVSKINRQVKQKYGRINQELDAISKDKDFVMKSIPEADRKLIDKAYIDARAQRMKGKETVDRAVDEASGLSGLFARSVSSGFLSGIASIGDAMSSGGYSNKLVDWMQNKRTAAEELKPAEYTWSGDPLKRAITSSGQSLGASAPLLAPSIGLMAATGGSAAGVVGSALLSYYGENKQNAGQVYRDVLEQSGDVALARDQARDYFQKTAVTLPLYFVGSLGEKALVLGKGLKKAAAGLGLELAEEIPVEYIQSHAEAVTSQGYKGSLAQYIKENPELMLDIAVGTGVQAGAMKTVAAAFSKVASAAPAPQTQTLADAIMTQGREFAARLVQTQFDQGLINEQKRDELFQSIGTIEANLAKLDELGVRGDAAKLHMALSQEMAELQANRKAEKDESVQAVLDSKINDLKTQMTGVLTGQTEYIVFGMPGDVNSKTMLASTFNALSQQEKDDTIRSAKSVTVINNPQLNQQLQDQKQALGNPEGAPEGAYETDATVQSQVEQQAGPAEGGVQERPGVDGGQQEVGQGAGQQGQAPVTQPDTGDRVLGGQEEVDLAGELRGELRQDFQPIIDKAAQSLQAANVQFEVLDDAEFTARVGQSAEGAFMTVGNDGKILLNRQKMEQADPGVIIWHESAHPVMNIVRNTNKPLYDRMVTGLKQLAQKSPELQRAIEFGRQYGTKLREAGRGDAEAIALEDDESIVESIAMIAADDKLMASLPTSIKQTLIDFVNYVAKALGIKARVTNTASADFRRTAQQIATALKEGRDITEIVGAENVGMIRPATQDIQLRSIEEMIANNVESKVVSGVKASTRIPSAKGAPADTHTSDKYIVDLKSQRESPSNYISNAIEISGYPIVSGLKESEIKALNDGLLPKSKGGTQDQVDAAMKVADKVYKSFIRSVADNLIWLHNHFNENLRLISRRWYDGANKIAQDYASKYGVTLEQASGVIAVLSPQMDWYKNVSLADRVLDIVKNKSKFVFDQNMADTYVRISANIQQFKNESDADFNKRLDSTVASAREEAKGLIGKALDSDPLMFPKTLRVYDETYNDKSYDILSPNAEPIGKATKKDGSFSSIGWQGYSTIAKAISIVNDGSAKNISIQLGEMHKVRNFYNNIADPNSGNGDVTIDTHAVAAGLLKPLAGSDLEVIANLSGKGSAITGSTGTYPAFADAYRLAAKEVGIQPRQMQSITWEAVRGLFKDTWKTSKNKALVNQIWKDYADGKNSIDETRKRIDEIAGGVEKPSWARSGSEAVAETGAAADSGQLPSGGNMGVQRASGARTATEREAGMVQPTTQLSIGNRQAIIDKAKADGTYLKAPNGQPTNLSEDQWTTVRTPEFKNWFGDWENDPANASKVVDENGEPMVVYHGSDKSFDTFMAGRAEGWGEGMYFASEESDTAEFGGIVYPVFLNIRNPINESNINKIGNDVVRTKVWEDESKRRGRWDEEDGVSELDYRDELEENVNLANKAWRELGYDGIMFFGSNNINGFEIVTFSPNQIKSATSNVGTFSTEDARIQFSIGGRQPVGRISWERSMEGKGDPSISSRNPIVTKAAQDLKDGKITNEEYRATVSENSPIRPITRFFEPATEQQVRASLSVDKSDKANAPLTDGTIVGLRLDIPAYQNKNTWVVSVHEGNTNSGKPISYRNVAMIRNVKFGSTPKGVLNIATGKEKQTIGRMFGEWVNIPGQTMEQQGENAKRMVQDIVDNPDYVQVGMNPFRHSYFYDRNTDIGRPIVSADEVIQVGGLVYAKNPVYGNWTDESYAVKGLFDAAGAQVQFSAGPRAESRVEFKLVAFVLRKKAEGHTDQQIASAIRSVMPGLTQQQVDNLVSNPEDFLFRAFPGITPMQFQNLLRRAQVKNIYRGNMPQNIAERFLSSMVPNEVLEKYYMQVKTKAQVRKDAINQFLTKNFDPAKGLPKWVMLLKEYSSGAKNLEIARAKSTLDRLAKTAREIGFTDWKTFSDALRNLNEEEAIMSGSTELTLFDPATGMAMVPSSGERLQRPLTLLRLPLEIQPYVREMRNQIDGLTKKLITGGFVTPEQAVTLEMNLGEYTNRAYELYTKKGFQPKKEAFDAAVRFLADQEYRRLLTEYINNLSVAVRGQIGVMTGAGPIVAESGTGIPYAKLAEEAAKYAERRANDIINKKETPYFGGSGPTSRGLGILKQRQTIPQPIRALMGEYTDPGVVFMMTVAKQAELAATSDFLRQLRDQGLGTLFFEKNNQNRPATHSVPLAGDKSATMEPLNGLYTTPEIAEAFEDAVNTRNAVVQLWMKIVGANRWFKTVGSIRTQFVNFESNLGFAVLNGLVFTKEGRPFNASFRRPLGKGLQEAGKYVKGQYGPKEMTEITEKLIKLGLVGQSIDINAIRKAFREDDMFEMALDVALTSEGVFKKKSISRIKPQAPFNKAYRMGDDFWKVYGYITERETVANGRYETSYDQLTDEQKDAVDKEAADRVKDTWPTYDRMFEAVRKLTQNIPILGNFPGFQGESIRVLMNAVRLMKKDLADPQMRQAGIRRALGISTYLGLRTSITTMSALAMGYGVSGVMGLLLNDDDEEDKKWAIKEVSPIFMRSGDLFIKQDKDKPHIYTVIDFLSIDPIGITQRSMNALTEGNKTMDSGVGAAVAELFGGFLEREMTFKAAEDLTLNRNSSNGLKIYNKEDTPGEAVGKITKYLYKSLKPSTIGLVERALTNENKAFEAAAFVGFRPYEIDLHQSFNISLTRMRNSIDEISAEYFKIKFDPKISEEDKEQARLRAGEKKAEVIKKYNRLYTTLIKLGASQEVLEEMVDEKKAVKPTGMDKKTKAGIKDGDIDPTTLY